MMANIKTTIRSLALTSPFFLAPMEAVNCASFRVLCKRRGAGLVFTDMIDADIFMQKVNEIGSEQAVRLLVNPQEDERPLVIQLGGANSENLLKTITILEPYADVFDYNVGCPLPYMLAKKGGVYLMKHPTQLYKIISAMRQAIKKPFITKIRSGWDNESKNAVEIAVELERIGVDAITVHARTKVQKYQDRADWPLVRKVKEAIHIPLILSGDVTNSYMAHMAFSHTKCDFIMCARGAMNNPSIFRQLNDDLLEKTENGFQLKKTAPPKPNATYNKKSSDVIRDFHEFVELYAEREHRNKISELQDHAIWAIREAKNSSILVGKIRDATDEKQLIKIVSQVCFFHDEFGSTR